MTSHLRPPRDPGRRVGRLPAPRRPAAPGRGRLLRGRARGARPGRRASSGADGPTPGHRRRAGARRRHARPPAPVADEALLQAVQAATSLVKAHRMHGHLAARLDPLGSEPVGDPALDPATVHLTDELMRAHPRLGAARGGAGRDVRRRAARACARPTRARSPTRSSTSPTTSSASGCARRSSAGAYRKPLERRGAARAARAPVRRSRRSRPTCTRPSSGKKQFSIEGLDALVPMLDEAIELASGAGAREVVLGMAHRGRLNVLAHTVGRPYESILVEFEGEQTLSVDTAAPEGGTGDVKYHYGASGTYRTRAGPRRDRHAVAQPEPPRVRQPGDRGPRARRPDEPQGARARPRPERRAAGADPRRRRLPRPGHRGRDAQPAGAARATPPAARCT